MLKKGNSRYQIILHTDIYSSSEVMVEVSFFFWPLSPVSDAQDGKVTSKVTHTWEAWERGQSVLEGAQLPDAVRVPLPWHALFVEPHGGWLPAFCVFTRKHSVPQRGISLEKSTPKSWWELFPKHGIIHFPTSLYVGSQFLLNHFTLFFDYKITQGWNHSRRVRTRAEI